MTTQMVLTDAEKAVIFGTLLGDAILIKRGESYRLRIAHSIKQKEYVDWKYKKLKRLCTKVQPPKIYLEKKKYLRSEFYTDSSLCLKQIHQLFYKPMVNSNGKTVYIKTITQELLDNLPKNPIVLAVWFLDDGSVRPDCYAGRLATQGCSYEEHVLLQDYFQKVYDIKTDIVSHLKRKKQYTLSFPAKSFWKLVNCIEPTVKEVPSMVYKLNEQNKSKAKYIQNEDL